MLKGMKFYQRKRQGYFYVISPFDKCYNKERSENAGAN
jgi:hypothetical protein